MGEASVSEFIQVANEVLLVACEYLDDPMKHTYLLEAPQQDVDGNPYIIRYNKAEDIHYLASEKDAKKTGNTAIYNGEKWVEATK